MIETHSELLFTLEKKEILTVLMYCITLYWVKKPERRTSIEMHHLHSESKIVFKYPITVQKAETVAYGRDNVRERTFYSMSILKTSILKVVLFSLLVLKSIIFLFLFRFSPYMKGILKCPLSLQDQTR